MRRIREVASVWPSGGSDAYAPTVTLHRKRSADRFQSWALVVSAFLLGLAVSAAVFVGIWRTTASRSDRAEEARSLADRQLRDANARSAALTKKLRGAKADLAVARRQERQLKGDLRSARRQATVASQAAAGDRAALVTLQHRASKVTSYVASLKAYVEATPAQDLDGTFLQSQLTYLSSAAQRLQAP